jgi:hypothetical protein
MIIGYLILIVFLLLVVINMKVVLVFCIMLLSYHFSDIDTEFMVMSGNIKIERSL